MGYIVPYMGTIRSNEPPLSADASRLGDALFTKVQQRVLGILLGNPGRSFYGNEIIRLADSGTGAVQRELTRLEAAGLVTVTRIGNQKHFQANPTAPIFDELRAVVLKTSGLADILRSALAPLAADIHAAFVFGSLAKREDTVNSDVDLMILSDTLTYPELYTAAEDAGRSLSRIVNPTIYTRSEWSRRNKHRSAFVAKVLAQPKIWLIGEDRDLAT
ncbi:MAG: transcriptional regulator [Gemmatimonadaceae bacterium]